MNVLAFSDLGKMEIWYTESILDRILNRIPGYKTPLEIELENVSSFKAFNKAVLRDLDVEIKQDHWKCDEASKE